MGSCTARAVGTTPWLVATRWPSRGKPRIGNPQLAAAVIPELPRHAAACRGNSRGMALKSQVMCIRVPRRLALNRA